MNNLLNVFLVILIIYYSQTVDAGDPKQKLCLDVKAVIITKELEEKAKEKGNMLYYVGRTRNLKEWTKYGEQKTNVCGILTYFKELLECEQITTAVISLSPHRTTETTAYSKKFNNYVLYTEEYQLIDPPFLIYRGSLKKMQYIDADDKSKIIIVPEADIPLVITDSENLDFALIKTNKNLDYLVYMTCNKEFVWIFYAEDVVNENRVDDFAAEILDVFGYVFNVEKVAFPAPK